MIPTSHLDQLPEVLDMLADKVHELYAKEPAERDPTALAVIGRALRLAANGLDKLAAGPLNEGQAGKPMVVDG